jgi:uncharacterized UPF0160 family protein
MDEIVALAIATLWLEKKDYSWEVIRTRSPESIRQANMVFDVGRVYDHETKRYDHHQNDFTLTHPNGILLASAGLAWKHYGLDLCEGDTRIHESMDSQFISSFDALDNGIKLVESVHPSGCVPFGAHHYLHALSPTWMEDSEGMHDAVWTMVEAMRVAIPRIIEHHRAFLVGQQKVLDAYAQSLDKRIVVLEEGYPWVETLSALPEPLIVVAPRSNGQYSVTCVRKSLSGFETRISLPAAWRGLEGPELQKVSGITDAVFCHRSGFKGITETLEGALAMAVYTVEHESVIL